MVSRRSHSFVWSGSREFVEPFVVLCRHTQCAGCRFVQWWSRQFNGFNSGCCIFVPLFCLGHWSHQHAWNSWCTPLFTSHLTNWTAAVSVDDHEPRRPSFFERSNGIVLLVHCYLNFSMSRSLFYVPVTSVFYMNKFWTILTNNSCIIVNIKRLDQWFRTLISVFLAYTSHYFTLRYNTPGNLHNHQLASFLWPRDFRP